MRQRLIVIGTGMSSLRLMETVVSEAPGAFEIHAFGEEPFLPYNRIKLSSYLQQEHEETALYPYTRTWYNENGITLHTGAPVTRIDPKQKLIFTENGDSCCYDKAVLATGASPVRLNIPGDEKENVHTFRTLADARRLKTTASRGGRAVVVGGGFLGLEAAYGMAKAGTAVDVVQRGATLLNPQLDETASLYLQRELETHGIRFHFNTSVQEVTGDSAADGVILENGGTLAADDVLFAAGIRPNTGLAEESGIHAGRGITVDDVMQTSAPDVYAVGECAEHRGKTYGLVPPVYDQARTAALHLAGKSPSPYRGSTSYSHLKIAGIDLFTAGSMAEPEGSHVLVQADSTRPLYQKVVMTRDMVQGAVLFGDTAVSDDIAARLRNQKPLSASEKKQLFSGEGKQETLIQCAPETTICKCNQVNKQTILRHIAATEDADTSTIQKDTRASTSCGGCAKDVKGLLQVFDRCRDQAAPAVFCSCTDLEEEEVQRRIFTGTWQRWDDVFASRDWHGNGCDACRPALRYYFAVTGQAELTQAPWITRGSGGSYAVTSLPLRGPDNAEGMQVWLELKHTLPGAELTFEPGSRLRLSGVPDEEVDTVCRRTGTPRFVQPSANLYPFLLETTQQQEIFMTLESHLFPLSLPGPFTIRSTEAFPAELSRQELAVVWKDGLWEMHAESAGGRMIIFAADADELEDMMKGIVQYYRETAFFNETFADWVVRLSPASIRETLLDVDMTVLADMLDAHINAAAAEETALQP
ncbi:FAD-dependent oxidoreductase [Salibacterium qingdaonense]|uniref:Nitrite reductase (NADH) large subunit n=1 Tax=Salibacterium qingdaonense TaxID=266892 RepID=A0A1I4LL48_9BACI|nr:FAD-dependent oxidoreductase [Salibacterium qingdaonense]SFL91702.1 nitrite reductase (NADH) large subunit [Salibacterium qingdaonense]